MSNLNVINDVEEIEITKLLSKMSVREKIGQCVMIEPFFCLTDLNNQGHNFSGVLDPNFLKLVLDDYHVGFFLYGGVTRVGDDTMLSWAKYIDSTRKYAKSINQKIPLLFGSDAIHGVNFVKGSTIFSHNLGVASTWNTELVKDYSDVVSKELSEMGMKCNFAPTIDVARDQRWGRVYESLGEDPYLASEMSKSLILGMQHNNKVAGCAKHFIGYGEASNGMDRTPADISERNIKEIHLPPFKAAIEAGVKMIMMNGGDLNGTPIVISKKMLKGVLREELGFRGVTMCDWEDVNRLVDRHHVAKNKEEAILKAFNAGLDMNMAVSDLNTIEIMEKLVKENKISMERLDEACGNVLRVKMQLNLFEEKDINTSSAVELSGNQESKDISKKLATESITLLKNENELLPLSKNIKSILVTGKTADSKRHLCGGWTLNWLSANEEDLNFPTIIDKIRDITSEKTKITYVSGVEDLNTLNVSKSDFDVCICVVGEEPHSEWLGDSMSMKIESTQIEMLKASYETGIPVVMVSILGRPVNMIWADTYINSILWAHLPGSEGAQAITDVLFGDYNPSGRTAITFPKDGNQIPIVYNARKYVSYEINTRYDPLYPFGYGLSYTTFEYSNLIVPKEVVVGNNCIISFTLKNIGSRAGTEVVQLYMNDVYASVTRPLKSLKKFIKVYLEANETKTIELVLSKEDFSLYDENLDFVQEERDIEIHIDSFKKVISVIK